LSSEVRRLYRAEPSFLANRRWTLSCDRSKVRRECRAQHRLRFRSAYSIATSRFRALPRTEFSHRSSWSMRGHAALSVAGAKKSAAARRRVSSILILWTASGSAEMANSRSLWIACRQFDAMRWRQMRQLGERCIEPTNATAGAVRSQSWSVMVLISSFRQAQNGIERFQLTTLCLISR
jgi:hypothetical protein